MRCLAALLMSNLLGLQACTVLFEADAVVTPPGSDGDAGQEPDCLAPALVQEDFSSMVNLDTWWTATDPSSSVGVRQNRLEFSLGATQEVRSATMGTQSDFALPGTLSLEVLDFDLQGDFGASFYLRLEPTSGEAVGLSISGGKLSLIHSSVSEASVIVPDTPFWLVLTIEGDSARLSHAKSGVLTTVGTAVETMSSAGLNFGLTAEQDSGSTGHVLRIGQFGDIPGLLCP